MYNQTLHHDRKNVCDYCLQSFTTSEIIETHVNDFYEINCKQTIKMAKRRKNLKFKNYSKNIKSPFMIYSSFFSIKA